MFNKEQNQYVALNYNIDVVFNALVNAVQTLKGFSISQADQVNHILYVDKAMSAWTWGESITITLNVNPSTNQTYVYFSSDSNLGTEIAAKKQNRKNIESIMNAMNQILMQQPQQQMYQAPQQQMYAAPQQMYPQQMPQQQMYAQPAQQMPVQQQYAAPQPMYNQQPMMQPMPQQPVEQQPVASTQHQGDALSDNMNNM